MQGHKFTLNYRFDGALAANKTIAIQLPFAVTVIGLFAGASNDSDATLTFGTAADPDGYLTAQVIGDSGAFVEFGKDEWDGALLPSDHVSGVDPVHVAADTVMNVVIDFDGATGTAAQNVEVILVLAEG